jgi:hypothetical protein
LVQLLRAPSLSFPVTVLGPNQLENAHWLETVEQAHREFSKILGETLPPEAKFEYVWLPPKNAAADGELPEVFPRQLRTAGGSMTWVVQARGEMPRDREILWRTSFLCQLQALVLARSNGAKLPAEVADPPLWLIEGMTQMLLPTRWDDWAKVVERYSRTEKLPTLRAVQEWDFLGADKLERLYRSAFCHRLLQEATATEAERQALAVWLKSLTFDPEAGPAFYWAANSRQEAWWKERTARTLKPSIPVHTWDESATRLREALHFNVKMKGETAPRLVSLATMPERPEDLQDLQAVQEALNRLLQAESQAHPVWRPILAQYRAALVFWITGKTAAYQQAVAKAGRMQEQAGKFMEQVGDYLDWVTVNYPMGQNEGSYSTYSELVRRLEQEQAPLARRTDLP